MTDRVRLTTVEEFEQFVSLPENADRRLELIDGEIVEKPMPTEEHGIIAANLVILIGAFLRSQQLGRIGVEIRHRVTGDAHNDRVPDVSVRLVEKDAPVVTQGPVPQMPDFAIEIQSPDDKLLTLREKALFYLDHGCQMVWLVLTRPHLVEVYRAGHDVRIFTLDETLDGGDMLPGFTLPVAEIFAM